MQGSQLAFPVDQANDGYVFGWGDVVAVVQGGGVGVQVEILDQEVEAEG